MATITDVFTATNGTHLAGRTTTTGSKTWQVTSDVYTIQSNKVEGSNTGWEQAWVDSGSTDGTAEVVVTDLGGYNAVIGRVSSSGQTYYAVVQLAGGGCGLYSYVSGSQTTLVSGGPAISEGDILGIRITGWLLEVLRNGTSVLSVTDTAHTIATGTGFGFARYSSGKFDDFAYSPSGDTTPPAVASIVTNGPSTVITYNEALDGGFVPATSAYTVKADGTPKAISNVAVSGSAATLTHAAVTSGQAILVSYVP